MTVRWEYRLAMTGARRRSRVRLWAGSDFGWNGKPVDSLPRGPFLPSEAGVKTVTTVTAFWGASGHPIVTDQFYSPKGGQGGNALAHDTFAAKRKVS